MNQLVYKNNNVTLNRGDTFLMSFTIEDESSLGYYELQEGDKLYFALMEPNQKWEDAVIKREYTSSVLGVVSISLLPSDTEYLVPGTYYYQIKLKLNDGTVTTLRQKTRFTLVD